MGFCPNSWGASSHIGKCSNSHSFKWWKQLPRRFLYLPVCNLVRTWSDNFSWLHLRIFHTCWRCLWCLNASPQIGDTLCIWVLKGLSPSKGTMSISCLQDENFTQRLRERSRQLSGLSSEEADVHRDEFDNVKQILRRIQTGLSQEERQPHQQRHAAANNSEATKTPLLLLGWL